MDKLKRNILRKLILSKVFFGESKSITNQRLQIQRSLPLRTANIISAVTTKVKMFLENYRDLLELPFTPEYANQFMLLMSKAVRLGGVTEK